ncbi:MAG TPA: DMT family transporter [Candidatus Binataceae bacterium]|nr:DMT family transporter [Candidatus Binataceae bacterium]
METQAQAGVRYALGAAALFGASTPAAKLLLKHLSPLMLSASLYLGAAIALSAYRLLGWSASRETPIGRDDIPAIAGIIFFGGILGPVLMLYGLQRISAFTGSLLLNLEGPFTALIAVGLLGEHLGTREKLAATAIMLGGMLVSLEPGYLGGSWLGAVEVAGACLSWGVDNNLTRHLSLRDPVAVARIKTSAAGLCVLALALLHDGARIPALTALLLAGCVGALCYGLSITLDVKALRMLGAAREAAYFATAPFVGALFSLVVFRGLPNPSELAGTVLMIAGVLVLVREKHAHLHPHEAMLHEHLHVHDDHHQHEHDEVVAEPHSHAHVHEPLTHAHSHTPDLHHRHRH